MLNKRGKCRSIGCITLDGSPAAWARTYSQNQPQMARSTRCAVICFSTITSLPIPEAHPTNHIKFSSDQSKGRRDPAGKGGGQRKSEGCDAEITRNRRGGRRTAAFRSLSRLGGARILGATSGAEDAVPEKKQEQ